MTVCSCVFLQATRQLGIDSGPWAQALCAALVKAGDLSVQAAMQVRHLSDVHVNRDRHRQQECGLRRCKSSTSCSVCTEGLCSSQSGC